MFESSIFKRGFGIVALVALLAIPSLALAHGSNVKIHDNARNQTWEVGYGDVTVNSNGTLSFWGTTVCQGTITFSDGNLGAYYGYSAIPVSSSNQYYNNNSASLGHSNSPGYCGLSSGGGGGSGGGNPAGNNGIGTLIAPGTAPLITQDGGSLITQDGGSLITQDGGSLIGNSSYHLLNASGHPTAKGSHNPKHFACEFVYVPGGSDRHYYTRFTVTPRTGLYACKADAMYLHLTDGGTWRG